MEEIPRTMIKTNPRIPAMQQPESINHPDWQGRAGQMAPAGITLRKKKESERLPKVSVHTEKCFIALLENLGKSYLYREYKTKEGTTGYKKF